MFIAQNNIKKYKDYGLNRWFRRCYFNGDDYFLVNKDGIGTKGQSWTLKSGDLYFMDRRLHLNHRHSILARKITNVLA